MNHMIARQEVEYLRRRYAQATDLIGTGSAADESRGRAVYEEIFSADVQIRTQPRAGEVLQAGSPSGWADVVKEALAGFCATQHLIGTQLVELSSLSEDAHGQVSAGEAQMQSYLHAWHEQPDGQVYIYIGNYVDRVEFRPGNGWQIVDMTLVEISSEWRPLGVRT